MPMKSTREMFVHELADLYDAEHQFLEAMEKMHEKASDEKASSEKASGGTPSPAEAAAAAAAAAAKAGAAKK